MKNNSIKHSKVLILGSGPAGYTAAIYAARADLKPVVIQGLQPGGQLTTTTDVDNYPGYPDGITGPEMMEDFKKQSERFGTDTRWGMVTKVDLSERPFKVEIDENKNVLAQTIIIATGASAKWLGIEDEKRLCEKNSDFTENFIKLSRDVHFLNDNRAKIKLEINNHTGSKIKEIKEYTSY